MRSRGPGRNSGSRDTQTHPRTGRASPAPQELQVPASSGLRGGLGDPGAQAGKSGPPGGMPPAERGSPPPERRHFCPRQPGSLALHARLDRGAPVRALLLRSPPSLARPPRPRQPGLLEEGDGGWGLGPSGGGVLSAPPGPFFLRLQELPFPGGRSSPYPGAGLRLPVRGLVWPTGLLEKLEEGLGSRRLECVPRCPQRGVGPLSVPCAQASDLRDRACDFCIPRLSTGLLNQSLCHLAVMYQKLFNAYPYFLRSS
ncbi:hypothetical protein VULLAG_LOCUS5952 [Vulpes lagopus]